MPLTKAQCPNCGGSLEVDLAQTSAVCPYCNTPYIVEKATTNITNNIQADTVIIQTGDFGADGNPNGVVLKKRPVSIKKEKQWQSTTGINPGWLTLLMIAVVCGLQIWVIPNLRLVWNGQLAIYLTVFVAALFLLLLIPLCGAAQGARLPDRGHPSAWLGGSAVMAGVGTAVTNLIYVYIWATNGVTPPPFSAIFNEVDRVSLIGSLVCGLLGGIALVTIGLRWLRGRSVRTLAIRWLTLLPILWAFARLIRYTESYTSTIRNAFSFPNAAMLILTTGFLLQLGRHLLGRGMGSQARSLAVLAFGTALMGISTPLLRILLTRFKPDYIAGVIQMADASDFCVGLLALAVGWTLCCPASDEPAGEEPEPVADEPTDPVEPEAEINEPEEV